MDENEKMRARSARWREKNREVIRQQSIDRDAHSSRHGPEYDVQLAAQGGKCAVCERSPVGKRLHWDHDHVSGQKRGILCTQCNIALGMSGDSPTRLRELADYLERYGEVVPT